MSEWWIVFSLIWGGTCFASGGFKGGRLVRRYALPAGLAVVPLLNGFLNWRALAFALALSFALHLGYGEKVPYWRKTLVFILYVLPVLLFGFTYWIIISPLAMLTLFKLSNWNNTALDFKWKICEFFYGTLIGTTLVASLGRLQ